MINVKSHVFLKAEKEHGYERKGYEENICTQFFSLKYLQWHEAHQYLVK